MPGQSAEAHFNLANSLRAAGKFHQAIAEYRRAVQLRPNYLDAHFKLGNTLATNGSPEEAAKSFRRVLQLSPNHVDALNNLGNTLLGCGQPEEAAALYRRVLTMRPEHFLARNNLAAGLLAVGEFEEAAEAARRAIAMKPDYPPARRNLGDALAASGKWSDAAESYKKLIELESARAGGDPGAAADARLKRGTALKHLARFDEAISLFREAVALMPRELEPRDHLAGIFWEIGYMDEALAIVRETVQNHPASAKAHNMLANVLMERGQLDDAIDGFARAVELDPSDASMHSNKIFACMFHPAYDSARLLHEARQWDRQHAPRGSGERPANPGAPGPHRKLRIGYVSADFRDHVIGRNVLPLLRERDRAEFEVFCYSDTPDFDRMNRQLRGFADGWRDIAGLPADKVAGQIRDDGVDLLVDLALHTGGNRLPVFALRPAPVQVTFGGYPGTTGLRVIDYRLTDPHLDPPGLHDDEYVERSIRLPHSFWCYDPAAMEVADIAEPGPPPAISAGHVTFGCLNNFRKVNDGSLQLWAKVMARIPGSRLLLLAPLGSHRADLANRMAQWGVTPDRIGFVDRGSRGTYLDSYRLIDIALDTIPYNGHTTSLDALWQGVPVVTLVGATVAGRAGFSQARNLRLTELVADSPEQFIAIASALAGDLPRLAELRASLRGRMRASPLCDAVGWTRGIEDAYCQMWQKWCETRRS